MPVRVSGVMNSVSGALPRRDCLNLSGDKDIGERVGQRVRVCSHLVNRMNNSGSGFRDVTFGYSIALAVGAYSIAISHIVAAGVRMSDCHQAVKLMNLWTPCL